MSPWRNIYFLGLSKFHGGEQWPGDSLFMVSPIIHV